MVTIVEKPKASSAAVIGYNEEKFFKGVSYFFWENFQNLGKFEGEEVITEYDIRKTLLGMEDNPEISGKTKFKSFHMTIDPIADDLMDEKSIKEYIRDLMDGLGYGEQPYVVYRHNDIEREHFHVVSTRVRKDGKIIPRYREGLRVRKLMMELQGKYGYSIGNAEPTKERMDEISRIREFHPEVSDKRAVIKKLFSDALGYYYDCPEQFAAVLGAMNLAVTGADRKKDRGQNMIVYGINPLTGKANSRRLSLENDLGVDAMKLYVDQMERVREAGGITDDNKIILQAVNEWCAVNSGSEDEYFRMLDALNVHHEVSYAPDGSPGGRFSRVILACTELRFAGVPLRIEDEHGREAIYGHSVIDTKGANGIRLSALNKYNTNGHWDAKRRYAGKQASAIDSAYSPALGREDIESLKSFVHGRLLKWKGLGENISKDQSKRIGHKLAIGSKR